MPAVERATQYVPVAQVRFDDVDGQNDPAGQSASLVVPAGHHEPRVHATCVAGVAQYDPAAQSRSVVVRRGQYEPEAHPTWVEGVAQTEPATHEVSLVELRGQ